MDEPPYTCETSEIMNKLDTGEMPETPAKEQGYSPLDAAACYARSPLTYALEQRLRLVDFLLAQYGHVKRAALMDYFGIGEATATRDFGAYHEIAPGNMALNPSDKTYYRTNAFARVWL